MTGDAGGAEVATVVVTAESALATKELARGLARHLRGGDVLVLAGELGAGKTTFTQGLAEGLGVRGPITSPTFVLARRHPSLVAGVDLVHVDAYRLTSPRDVDDLDLDSTLASSVTVVEWGTGLAEQLSTDRLAVTIDVIPAGEAREERRTLTLRGVGPRWAALAQWLA